MPSEGGRRGRRDNGLDAAAFVPLVDVDPRVGEHLLDVLASAGVPAFLEPSADIEPYTRTLSLPSPPTDRLWVDRDQRREAREIVDAETPYGTRPAPTPREDEPSRGLSDLEEERAWKDIVSAWDAPAVEPTRPQRPSRGAPGPGGRDAGDPAGTGGAASDTGARGTDDAGGADGPGGGDAGGRGGAGGSGSTGGGPGAGSPAGGGSLRGGGPGGGSPGGAGTAGTGGAEGDREGGALSGAGTDQPGARTDRWEDNDPTIPTRWSDPTAPDPTGERAYRVDPADRTDRTDRVDGPGGPGGPGGGPRKRGKHAADPPSRRRWNRRRQDDELAGGITGSDLDRAAEARARAEDDAAEDADELWLDGPPELDEGHYEPPPPPPVPRLSRQAVTGLLVLALGFFLLASPGTLGFDDRTGLTFGVLAILGGGTLLVLRLREHRTDDGPDDGAVV